MFGRINDTEESKDRTISFDLSTSQLVDASLDQERSSMV